MLMKGHRGVKVKFYNTMILINDTENGGTIVGSFGSIEICILPCVQEVVTQFI